LRRGSGAIPGLFFLPVRAWCESPGRLAPPSRGIGPGLPGTQYAKSRFGREPKPECRHWANSSWVKCGKSRRWFPGGQTSSARALGAPSGFPGSASLRWRIAPAGSPGTWPAMVPRPGERCDYLFPAHRRKSAAAARPR
jgi:hypothetical protein